MQLIEAPFSSLLSTTVDNRGRSCPTSPSGIPLIATNCIRNESLYPRFDNVRYVSGETYETWFRGHPEPGDIIFVNKGTPGRVCLVPDPVDFVIAQDMVAVRANPSKVYPHYLFAALRSMEVQERIEQLHVGTMIPHFKKSDFERLRIPIPAVRRDQEFIGDVYFALSRKIDVNRRMNRTLEATAGALFRSWFVDFDPVVAKAEGRRGASVSAQVHALFPDGLADVNDAVIPIGWSVSTFGQIAAPHRDFVSPRQIEGMSPYIAMDNMPRRSIALDSWEIGTVLDSAKARYRRGDVLFGKLRPYFHKVGIAPNDGVCSTEILVLRPAEADTYGLLVMIASSVEFVEYASAAAEGTRMPRVSWDYLSRYPITLPPAPIAREFTAMVQPMFDRIISNVHENRTLAALRDTLLPQLLSGAIRLRDAERAVGVSV